jgi:poly(3-hydroxybutyrate) depolymerase
MDARFLIKGRLLLLLLLPLGLLTGCPVTQSQDTPVAPMERLEPRTRTSYRLYVPSTYTSDRAWPLVITLHGTFGFDGLQDQVNEWKALAEREGFLVAAPPLRSVQGILPRIRGLWYSDLLADERVILALLEDVQRWYRVDPHAVLLTGFSAGGFPMYWTGLRSPGRFSMLIARAANCDGDMLRSIPITDATRKMPVAMYCAVDDLAPLRVEAIDARDWLRSHGMTVLAEDTRGGHTRSPQVAWRIWRDYQAAARRDPARAPDPVSISGGNARIDYLLVP